MVETHPETFSVAKPMALTPPLCPGPHVLCSPSVQLEEPFSPSTWPPLLGGNGLIWPGSCQHMPLRWWRNPNSLQRKVLHKSITIYGVTNLLSSPRTGVSWDVGLLVLKPETPTKPGQLVPYTASVHPPGAERGSHKGDMSPKGREEEIIQEESRLFSLWFSAASWRVHLPSMACFVISHRGQFGALAAQACCKIRKSWSTDFLLPEAI